MSKDSSHANSVATEEFSVKAEAVTVEAFERFMRELATGALRRNAFQPWEVDLLLDIQQVRMQRGRSEQLMRRYRQAARKFLEKGHAQPLKMSEYLAGAHRRAKAEEEAQKRRMFGSEGSVGRLPGINTVS